MARLFIEISCEEIPARMQARAIEALSEMLSSRLAERGFGAATARTAISPRHMAVELEGLEAHLPASQTERRGPRADAPDKAVDGFCQSAGLSRDQLELRDTDKGAFFFAVITQDGVELDEVITAILQDVISTFPWPKSQRWAETSISWVRPLRGVSVSRDGKPLTGHIHLSDSQTLAFQTETTAHPFYQSAPVPTADFDSYIKAMEAGLVIVDRDRRKAEIQRQMAKLADQNGLEVISDAGLLEEITGLVEWPQAICGTIDDSFMALPSEVLITSMRVHQKFFALSSATTGATAPAFITIANRRADEKTTDLIRAGNERVLRARLSDAAFFYDQDRQSPLAEKISQLSQVTFYEGLGSMGQKSERLAALAAYIAPSCGADEQASRRAGQLAKADLVTGMVGEFPELQGIMGGYYAAHDAEDEAVSVALSEHYRPAGPNDSLPSRPEAFALSLADKIDTLVGFFAIGAKPTGSRDPYALRRAALGILRMIDEADLSLNLHDAMLASAQLYGYEGLDDDLPGFIIDRLKVSLRDQNISHDVVSSVLSASEHADGQTAYLADLRLHMRLSAQLQEFLSTDAGRGLVAGWRRVASILAAEEKKAPLTLSEISEALFETPAEQTLYTAVSALSDTELTDVTEISGRLVELAGLAGPINSFFDAVVVNADDSAVRINRLALLSELRTAMRRLADFSQIEAG